MLTASAVKAFQAKAVDGAGAAFYHVLGHQPPGSLDVALLRLQVGVGEGCVLRQEGIASDAKPCYFCDRLPYENHAFHTA